MKKIICLVITLLMTLARLREISRLAADIAKKPRINAMLEGLAQTTGFA